MVRRFSLEKVSTFSGNMSMCLSSGLDVPESLRIAGRFLGGPPQQSLLPEAIERSQSGMELHESLEPLASRLPPFFIPVVRCGEKSGRADQVLRYLQEHCRLLVKPTQAMRNTWLYPLVIIFTGSMIELTAHLLLSSFSTALAFFWRSFTTYAMVAVVVFVVVYVPKLKVPIDALVLSLPVIGPARRELALSRFFHVFNVLYSTGGMRVEHMITLAASVVTNLAVRADLLQAAHIIERGGTLAEAFQAPSAIESDQKATIHAGEEAGKLDEAFDAIARKAGESLQFRLKAFNEVSLRIIMATVGFSAAITLGTMLASIL